MKNLFNFFKNLWKREDSKLASSFEKMANNPNFRELTEEEMRNIRA